MKSELELAEITEYGVRFATGVPVVFKYLRNTQKAPNFGARYGQDIEPAGRYIIHNPEPGDLPARWEAGVAEFHCPLVIPLSADPEQIYGPRGWKATLARHFKAKGRTLSRKLRGLGYDGIVTVHDGGTREIVDLEPGR